MGLKQITQQTVAILSLISGIEQRKGATNFHKKMSHIRLLAL